MKNSLETVITIKIKFEHTVTNISINIAVKIVLKLIRWTHWYNHYKQQLNIKHSILCVLWDVIIIIYFNTKCFCDVISASSNTLCCIWGVIILVVPKVPVCWCSFGFYCFAPTREWWKNIYIIYNFWILFTSTEEDIQSSQVGGGSSPS